jgi:hypothetical protein
MHTHCNDWQVLFLKYLQALKHYRLCNQSVFVTYIVCHNTMAFLLLFIHIREYSSNDKSFILYHIFLSMQKSKYCINSMLNK